MAMPPPPPADGGMACDVRALHFARIAPSCSRHMALRLSHDEWRCISDFLQSAVLSHVCHRTWTVLHRRHLCWHATPTNVLQMAAALRNEAALRTLHIVCDGLRDADAQALATIKDVPRLEALTLNLQRSQVTDKGAQALASLKDVPSLTVLDLNLQSSIIMQCERIRDTGVQALATLKEAPSLKVQFWGAAWLCMCWIRLWVVWVLQVVVCVASFM